MTRSGVGRRWRTASRPAYAPPAGGTSSRLPSIQAAPERTPARAGRAALRFGLRTLVVAGFAGAAWLLYANAAQAADAPVTDRSTNLSAVDLVGSLGSPPSDRTASTSLSHTDAATTAHQPVLGSAAARLIGSAPVSTATSVVLPGATTASPVPIADPAPPAGATGAVTVTGSANLVGVPVMASLDALTRPVSGWLHAAVEPVDAVLDAAASPLTGVGPPGLIGALSGRVQSGHVQSRGVRSGRVPSGVDAPAATAPTGVTAVRHGRAVTAAGRHVVGPPHGGVATVAPESTVGTAGKPDGGSTGKPAAVRAHRTGTTDVPVGPLPAPTRGWAPGGSTYGSSVSSESGGYAVASNLIATGTAAVRRPAVAAEVEVARLDAEAPTVSPD